jgi:transcriptional regulator GlxA family with amidase domain
VGGGNLFLADAGLLHNRMFTANNFSRDKFKQRYSNVEVHSERSIVESDGIYTCIGNQASRYVLYYLLAQLSSEAIAKNTENTFTAELSMQAFTEGLLSDPSEAHQDEEIWRIQQWVQLHFAESISLDNLAAKANMSLRTFKRRFKQATSLAPLHYLQNLRVEQGKEFLKHTNKNVGEISRLVGYEDTGHFIRLFKRSYDKSPQQWRKHYQTA